MFFLLRNFFLLVILIIMIAVFSDLIKPYVLDFEPLFEGIRDIINTLLEILGIN